ncbi:SfiI family type II restriction endonuclease [Vogesella sp. DC21W]|uniref:SfiI family type II restriction endonuclease n=1 Tax=Vogesella aquatica TaxID=2984206 RepID=A0ABT5ITU3_9NEIS|nr:SfiI family type II restriction endonuclease [Vogesella aquatica]MDC7715988.1 SfiI family type II restriction endonuclease [Vogesella aquatica]
MNQDYRNLTDDEHEAVEKQSLRMIVQALQEYSREAKQIFDNTKAPSKTEVIVLAEDLVQYALEVAETYPINRRYAGFIDYKRIRWLPTPYGLLPQALLVDAKASTENNRETLQQSQLPMNADFISKDVHVTMNAGVEPHLELPDTMNGPLHAVTTSLFVHFYYRDISTTQAPYRELKSIYALAIPHARFKPRYNPDPTTTFFGQGKHSSARDEDPRIRVYFTRLMAMCPWRLQCLNFNGNPYAEPMWRDGLGPTGTITPFAYLGR